MLKDEERRMRYEGGELRYEGRGGETGGVPVWEKGVRGNL